MSALTFSAPNLATVAYADVSSDGSSTRSNSGVVTTRLGLGTYAIILPTNLGQLQASDLFLVQIKREGAPLHGIDAVVDDNFGGDQAQFEKVIYFFDGTPSGGSSPPASSTNIDTDFNVLILRTTITPPVGAPA